MFVVVALTFYLLHAIQLVLFLDPLSHFLFNLSYLFLFSVLLCFDVDVSKFSEFHAVLLPCLMIFLIDDSSYLSHGPYVSCQNKSGKARGAPLGQPILRL